jgi:uncharacterized protein (TIGR03437 family)
MRRWGTAAVLLILAASSAPGYYHFVHYQSRLGPYSPIVEKFDLNSLTDKTVPFYVSEDRPALAPSDTYEALVAQIRQALGAWNGVATSDLRVAFGGVGNLPATAPSPAGEITFEELPPGVLGLCGPSTRGGQSGGFVPILRSKCMLPRDLSNASRTSASESFFNSLVHEVGHALGLQHTATSSAMSMEPTRSTTRARPLAADDVAGLSALYPAAGFSSANGTIAGRVITGTGRGVHLGSVVAVNASGAAVSALTAPDGTYRMEGVPPGSYLVYAHALPPSSQTGFGPAGVVLPTDVGGTTIEASGPFETQFFGGGRDPNTSIPVVVGAGTTSEGIDFRVTEKTAVPVFDVTTYSYPGNGAPAVFPAFLNISRNAASLIATGPGLLSNLRSTTVALLGGGVQVRNAAPYAPDPRFAEIEVEFNPFIGTGSRHLVFTTGSDVYIRPGGVQLVGRPAPLVRQTQIESDAAGNPVLVLAGDNLTAESRVFVDGAAATARGFDEATARLRVTPPPGMGSRSAVISVYNADGQSSVFVQPASPPLYVYPPADAPALTVNPPSAPAGRDVMVEIQGTNTTFVEGQSSVGFGTPDIAVRRVWVTSPTRLLAVISISPRAALGAGTVSVLSGSQLALLPAGFRIEAANGGASTPVISFQGLVNSATSQPRVAPGALATLVGSNLTLGGAVSATGTPLPATLGGTTVTINDRAVPLLLVSSNQINLQLPFALAPGPAILRVNNGAETSLPLAVQIDAVAPGLFRATTAAGATVDLTNPARLGETLVLYGTGFGAVNPPATAGAAAGAGTAAGVVRVSLGGIELTPAFAGLAPGTTGVYQVNVAVPAFLALTGATQVAVTVDGVASNALAIALR